MRLTAKHAITVLTALLVHSLTINAAANPTQLKFITQPTNAAIGTALPVIVVQLADKNGLAVAQSGTTILLSLNKSGLTGTTNLATDAQGKASFSNLMVSAAGSGYTLTASAPVAKYKSATSSSFSITKGGTSITLASSLNPAVYGQGVAFTARVSTVTGTPTGTVTLRDGSVTLGTMTLTGGGAAVFTTNRISATSHAITALYNGDANFLASTSSIVTETISKLGLTVSGIIASNKTYDGSTTVALNFSKAALNGVLSGDTVTMNTKTASGAFASKAIGTNNTVIISGITLGGASSNNYSITQPGATANIASRSLTISATAAAKVYDGTTTATVFLSDNRVAGDLLTNAYALAVFGSKNPGTNMLIAVSGLTVTGPDAANYFLIATSTKAATNISAAKLTVAAASLSRPYGANNPSLTATYSGFVTGESLGSSDVTGAPALATTASTNSSPGTYPITISKGTLTSADYSLVFTNGILTVTKANTTASITTTVNPAHTNDNVTFAATISPPAGTVRPLTGNIQFFNGAKPLGNPVALASGKGSLTITAGTLGQSSSLITAAYSDPGGNFNSSSNSLAQSVVIVVTPPPPSKLSLSAIGANGTVSGQIAGVAGQAYVIQTSTDLINWISLSTNVADTNGIVWLVNSNAVAAPKRFYRAYSP